MIKKTKKKIERKNNLRWRIVKHTSSFMLLFPSVLFLPKVKTLCAPTTAGAGGAISAD
jgi:hypothetical protein